MCLADDCAHTDTTFNCVKFLHNFDGDTFTVDIPGVHPFFGNSISIRVLGIDTAEMSSKNDCARKKALAARKRTQDLLNGANTITLSNIKKDKYFRVLASVTINGNIDLAQVLLDEKLAYKYDGSSKPKTDWCSMLTKSAPTKKSFPK
jgi:endonuclease YncB( thermonuclease family)